MPSLVEIQYNPYLPQVNILIDGKQPADFSRLIQYSDEDIWMWASEISYALYAEIRDEYNLCFVGNDFDAEIVKKICEDDEHCVGFRKKEFVVADSIQERMVKLNQLIKKIGVTTYDRTVIDAQFYISSNLQYLVEKIKSIDINNLFCSVRVQIIGNNLRYEESDNSILFIVTDSNEDGEKLICDHDLEYSAYVIVLGDKTQITKVTNKGIFIETNKEEYLDTIFRCFLQRPLAIALRRCVDSIHSGNKVRKELAKIISIEPVVNISVASEVEVGRSVKLDVSFEPDIGSFSNFIYRIRNPNIASCDGLNLYGLKEGMSVLEVYKQGDSKPLFVKKFKVHKRNRITKLLFSDDSLLLGIGDSKQIKLDYYPVDADNRNQIIWKSSDESIVSVNQTGMITAKASGKCRIICTAENISSQCICSVLPYMEELIFDTGENGCIKLSPMQEYALPYTCIPEECIDRKLTILSSNNNVVNVVKETLYAKNKGSAKITIKNESGSISRTLDVVVDRHASKEKKDSFFRKLFS